MTIDGPAGPASAGRPGRRWWGWLLGALPALVFLATFGLFFVDKSREARTVLRSGRGLLTVAALVGGYLVLALLLRHFLRWAWVAPVALTAVVLGLAAWIVRPYYVDETADRRLVAGPVPDASPTPAPAPEQRPPGASPPAPVAPAGPVRVSTGTIRGLGHDAAGTVSIIRNPDTSLVVRFEDFDVEGTPDPQVYLVQGGGQRHPGAGVALGRLRGNRGQVLDYAVPKGTDAGGGWTVLVWCRTFSVPIAHATQVRA